MQAGNRCDALAPEPFGNGAESDDRSAEESSRLGMIPKDGTANCHEGLLHFLWLQRMTSFAIGLLRRLAQLSDRERSRPRRRERDARSLQSGYTLVEILVVLAIIGLLMGLVGPRVMNYLSDSKIKTARLQIDGFSAALDLYYLDAGRYPNSSDGLAALVRKPDGVQNWNGPYLRSNAVPNDPWGRPYRYIAPGNHGPFDIISLGPEGREGEAGAAANITSWQR